MYGAQNGHLDIIKLLLRNGANKDKQDDVAS
jgi:ankyrin repeat protein